MGLQTTNLMKLKIKMAYHRHYFFIRKQISNFELQKTYALFMAKEVVTNIGVSYNSLTLGSKIIGNIVADNDFRIDGEVQGDISCKGKVVFGPHCIIHGNISCISAEIAGVVNGNITVSESLTLKSSAKIKGEVKTKMLIVEPDAVFNGSCSMIDNQ